MTIQELCKRYRRNVIELRRNRKKSQEDRGGFRRLRAENRKLRREIEEYIKGIDDPINSFIVAERVLRCRSWQSVARLLGGGNTADGVRMRYVRQLTGACTRVRKSYKRGRYTK